MEKLTNSMRTLCAEEEGRGSFLNQHSYSGKNPTNSHRFIAFLVSLTRNIQHRRFTWLQHGRQVARDKCWD